MFVFRLCPFCDELDTPYVLCIQTVYPCVLNCLMLGGTQNVHPPVFSVFLFLLFFLKTAANHMQDPRTPEQTMRKKQYVPLNAVLVLCELLPPTSMISDGRESLKTELERGA